MTLQELISMVLDRAGPTVVFSVPFIMMWWFEKEAGKRKDDTIAEQNIYIRSLTKDVTEGLTNANANAKTLISALSSPIARK